MPNSARAELVSPLVVAAHDAGAANLIIGWVRGRCDLELRPCVAGPAAKLWTAAFGAPPPVLLEEAMRGAAALLSGTSYASNLEHEARNLARECGVHSIGVIDHWVNYPQRFIRGGQQVLPDEIWVADAEARAIAADCFPGTALRQKPNLYLADLVAQVEAAVRPNVESRRRVLYALEPIRHPWAATGDAGEFQALDYFLQCGQALGLGPDTAIRLRPHPSDPDGKYDRWLARQCGWDLSLDRSRNLAESIAWADTVAGCETYALVVALAAGRCVISTLPPPSPRCRLPMKGIIHLRDITSSHHSGPAS